MYILTVLDLAAEQHGGAVVSAVTSQQESSEFRSPEGHSQKACNLWEMWIDCSENVWRCKREGEWLLRPA